jgi:carbamoyl-phosphate synthase large subunit
MSSSLNVLISAAGRRPYLLRWFREALRMNGVSGSVILADADRHVGGRQEADLFVEAPLVSDDGYPDWLRQTLETNAIDLAISVNDFELSMWSTLNSNSALIRLPSDKQAVAEDKVALAQALAACGISSPRTWTGAEVVADPTIVDEAERYVVKARFGSGSVGLAMSSRRNVVATVQQASEKVYGRDGSALTESASALSAVIVQQRIDGAEYGLDVISDLDRRYRTTFARLKVAMRAGETEKAITVEGSPFGRQGRQIAGLLGHRGPVDVDVLVDADGIGWVIDVNPRFGGGYPLTHAAGAHLPAALIAWAVGTEPDDSWLKYEAGARTAKIVDVARAE